MGNLNTVTMSGRLTRDPEWRDVGDAGVCGLSLAVNTRFKSGSEWKDKGHFFDWAVWRGLGEWCRDNLHKGDLVVVSGRAEQRSWEKDGQKRSAINFVASDIEMAASNGGAKRDAAPKPAAASEPLSFDDDTPF